MHLVVNAVASISLILICLQDNICFGITDNTTIQSTTLEKSDLKSNENEPNNGTATAITMTFVFLGIAVVLAVLYKRRLFGVRDIMDQFCLKLTKCCYHTEGTPSTGTDDPTTEDGNEEGVETSGKKMKSFLFLFPNLIKIMICRGKVQDVTFHKVALHL